MSYSNLKYTIFPSPSSIPTIVLSNIVPLSSFTLSQTSSLPQSSSKIAFSASVIFLLTSTSIVVWNFGELLSTIPLSFIDAETVVFSTVTSHLIPPSADVNVLVKPPSRGIKI